MTSPEPVETLDLSADLQARALAEQEFSRSLDRPTVSPSPSASPAQTQTSAPKPAGPPTPVAGLNQKQMNNAATIVEVGLSLGLPKRALIIGVATAMQESNLYNVASQAVPESFDYPHEGSSSDHDSVGVFQQRPSAGWGTVANLMKPEYQAGKFFAKLKKLDWESMSLTQAAQAVQISAYPNAYAKHETRATTIVNALT